MSYAPVVNNEIPERPLQLVRVILADYRRLTICARFAKNLTSPVMGYKRVERVQWKH